VLEFLNFGSNLFTFSEGDGEETHLDEDVAEEFGGLLGDGVTGQKDIILLGPFFNFGLILVKGLESINIDEGDAGSGGLLDMGSIGEDADLSDIGCTLMLLKALWGRRTVPLNLLSGS
jgi:hypothetical protein